MRVWGLWVSLLAALGALAASSAQAQGKVVIYRCTDAIGQLTVQNNTPCPKGSTQEKRIIEDAPVSSAPPTVITGPGQYTNPAPPMHPPVSSQLPQVARPPQQSAPAAAQAGAPALASPLPKSAIADADRLPPPALYECRTYDNGRYLSDTDKPPQRCAPLQTTGLGSVGSGVGVACQMVDDQCQRIADERLCEGWKQRLREAESALRFGRADSRDVSAGEFARIQRIVVESTCGR